jgi:hypothetical protein
MHLPSSWNVQGPAGAFGFGALKAEFDGYITELRDPNNSELRTRFKKKMSDIVKES